MRSRLSSIGERVYELNKGVLERDHMDKIVALSEKGVAGIGDSLEEAYEKAREKHPEGLFYFRRVGPRPAVTHMFLL